MVYKRSGYPVLIHFSSYVYPCLFYVELFSRIFQIMSFKSEVMSSHVSDSDYYTSAGTSGMSFLYSYCLSDKIIYLDEERCHTASKTKFPAFNSKPFSYQGSSSEDELTWSDDEALPYPTVSSFVSRAGICPHCDYIFKKVSQFRVPVSHNRKVIAQRVRDACNTAVNRLTPFRYAIVQLTAVAHTYDGLCLRRTCVRNIIWGCFNLIGKTCDAL